PGASFCSLQAAGCSLRTSGLFLAARGHAPCLTRFCFFQDPHFARGVIRDAKDRVVFDLGLHAVAFDVAFAPGPRVEFFGVFEALPLVDAAGDAVLAPNEVLADETFRRAESGSDHLVVVAAGGTIDVAGEAIAHDCGNHLEERPGASSD